MTSKQIEPATDEVHAWNRPGDSIEQIAQNIMDEACLGIAYYQNGVVSALQATIVSALSATREQAVRECAEIALAMPKMRQLSPDHVAANTPQDVAFELFSLIDRSAKT